MKKTTTLGKKNWTLTCTENGGALVPSFLRLKAQAQTWTCVGLPTHDLSSILRVLQEKVKTTWTRTCDEDGGTKSTLDDCLLIILHPTLSPKNLIFNGKSIQNEEKPILHHFRHILGLKLFTLAHHTCKLEPWAQVVCGNLFCLPPCSCCLGTGVVLWHPHGQWLEAIWQPHG